VSLGILKVPQTEGNITVAADGFKRYPRHTSAESLSALVTRSVRNCEGARQCDSAYKARTSQTTKQIITRVPIKPYPNIAASVYPILTWKVREGLSYATAYHSPSAPRMKPTSRW
jgi:hypothetical protein